MTYVLKEQFHFVHLFVSVCAQGLLLALLSVVALVVLWGLYDMLAI